MWRSISQRMKTGTHRPAGRDDLPADHVVASASHRLLAGRPWLCKEAGRAWDVHHGRCGADVRAQRGPTVSTLWEKCGLLIDHAWGWEPTTIEAIKAYWPSSNSLGSGQVLHCPYNAEKARLVLREMADMLSLDLVDKGLVTDQLVVTVGYDIENLTDPARKSKVPRCGCEGSLRTPDPQTRPWHHQSGRTHIIYTQNNVRCGRVV